MVAQLSAQPPNEVENDDERAVDDRLRLWRQLVDYIRKEHRGNGGGEQSKKPDALPFETSGIDYENNEQRDAQQTGCVDTSPFPVGSSETHVSAGD
jgi:hypothetical protein